jgi:hypothetical protein
MLYPNMPSVSGGNEFTGFSRKNFAVDEEFRSGPSWLCGALNW